MRKRWKNYIVFTTMPYRITVYTAMPAVFAAIGFWIGKMGFGDGGVMFAAVLLPLAEICSDYWLFGGIQAKDMAKADYMKTSGRGRKVMRDALTLDLFRKLLTAVGSVALCALALRKGGAAPEAESVEMGALAGAGMFLRDFSGTAGRFWWWGTLLYFALLSWFLSVLGTFLSRYAGLLWMNLTIGYGAVFLGALGMFGIGIWRYIWGLAALAGTAGAMAGIGAVKAAMRKVEGSYYDA